MGRSRRSFFDKRNSETYQLVYRSAEDVTDTAESGRVLFQPGNITQEERSSTHDRPKFPFDYGDVEELTEEQEKEIVELGLPLDGYNYLKHLRGLGSGKAELPVSNQGAVFVSSKDFFVPETDHRFIRATGLVLHSPANDETQAEESMRSQTTTAFSKVIHSIKGQMVKEVEALDSMMGRFEGDETEEGDLLDSFVLDATAMDDEKTLLQEAGVSGINRKEWIALPEDLSSEEDDDDSCEMKAEDSTDGKTRVKSVGRSRFSQGDVDSSVSFSERWKGMDPTDFEGRKPRTCPLEIIDEKFESVLDEYNEEDIGELEDNSDDGMTMEELSKCLRGMSALDKGRNLCTKKKKHRLPERLGDYKLMKPKRKMESLKYKDREALQATKEQLALNGDSNLTGREEWEHIFVSVKSQTPLDCESSWSQKTRSTTYQPSLIKTATKSKQAQNSFTTNKIELSSKTGLPLDVQKEDDQDEVSCVSQDREAYSCRSQDETLEEKKCRKQKVKQAQKEARMRKKQTKILYRQATVQQQKQTAGMVTKNASVIQL